MSAAFNAQQLLGLQVSVSVTSSLSLLSSLAVIFIVFSRHNHDPNKLPGFLSIADMCLSLFTCVGRGLVSEPDSLGCHIQAWGIQVFFIATMLWNTAMSFNVLLCLAFKWSVDDLPKLSPYYHAIIWGSTITMSTVLAATNKFGDAILWCWLPGSETALRMGLFYGIVWVCGFFNLIVYVFIGYELWKAQRQLKNVLSSSSDLSASKVTRQSDPVLKYARRASLFILAYFFVWMPASVNRVQNSIPGSQPLYPLFVIQAITEPLQGFTTFLIYFWRVLAARRRYAQTDTMYPDEFPITTSEDLVALRPFDTLTNNSQQQLQQQQMPLNNSNGLMSTPSYQISVNSLKPIKIFDEQL
ncbi:hypothetical protein SmJEL517_g03938 [Synchytrium microbalum]|uniref:G-protein coupled receptors family 2 profile 2 domain-containing protein n=1 Tax=Synchytrium microbalum TaxID=1806994 RepID=A0A507BW98_9FUNG|nr:uncharacterized protein SmJEL517_g03938 [Synchytrium microbalum]TPX33117.1 hypothetical protein SmJEL517_g03938 [Synchytrium microbalum]